MEVMVHVRFHVSLQGGGGGAVVERQWDDFFHSIIPLVQFLEPLSCKIKFVISSHTSVRSKGFFQVHKFSSQDLLKYLMCKQCSKGH